MKFEITERTTQKNVLSSQNFDEIKCVDFNDTQYRYSLDDEIFIHQYRFSEYLTLRKNFPYTPMKLKYVKGSLSSSVKSKLATKKIFLLIRVHSLFGSNYFSKCRNIYNRTNLLRNVQIFSAIENKKIIVSMSSDSFEKFFGQSLSKSRNPADGDVVKHVSGFDVSINNKIPRDCYLLQ